MNVLILNGGPGDGRGATCRQVAATAARLASAEDWRVHSFDLDAMSIKPCRACFACWLKHPGTCAIRDDEEQVLKAMASSEIFAWITPVTFGGYSAALKKALDRSIPILLPFFVKQSGETHHPHRYETRRRLLVFGTLPRPDAEAEGIFQSLVRRNALNLNSFMTESRVFYDDTKEAEISGRIGELLAKAGEAG